MLWQIPSAQVFEVFEDFLAFVPFEYNNNTSSIPVKFAERGGLSEKSENNI